MTNKFPFAPYDEPADATLENLEKLNRLRSLYYAHLDSGLPVKAFAGNRSDDLFLSPPPPLCRGIAREHGGH